MSKYAEAGVSLETARALAARLKQILGKGIGLFSGSQCFKHRHLAVN